MQMVVGNKDKGERKKEKEGRGLDKLEFLVTQVRI